QTCALPILPIPIQTPTVYLVAVGVIAAAEIGAKSERGFGQHAFEPIPRALVRLQGQGLRVGSGRLGVTLRSLARPAELEPGRCILRLPQHPFFVGLDELVGSSGVALDPAQAEVDVRLVRRPAASVAVLLYRFG